MLKLVKEPEILIESISKDIDFISKRIFAIKKSFYQTNNLFLRKRLSKEYSYLYESFMNIKGIINLFYLNNRESISYSSILIEKYSRYEKLIFKYKNLLYV